MTTVFGVDILVSRGRTGKQGFLMHVSQGFGHQHITRKQAGVTLGREKMFMVRARAPLWNILSVYHLPKSVRLLMS
jgi:hypothetical protein